MQTTLKVLVTDDDEAVRSMIGRMLEREGYLILEASDGKECLALYDQHTPDIILLDAMMPELDGFETCEAIRKRPEGADVPILMVTALDQGEAIDRAFRVGATDYLTKPVQWAVLRKRVQRLIQARQADVNLKEKIEQLDILNRIDRELGYTLDLQRVLNFAMDVAVRWSGAEACIVGWIEEETQQLGVLAQLGSAHFLTYPIPTYHLRESEPFLGRIFDEKSPYYTQTIDEQRSDLLIPLQVQGTISGVLVLERLPQGLLNNKNSIDFLQQLAGRTAAAIEKTRIYSRTEAYANNIDTLHRISTVISSNLNPNDVVQVFTHGLLVLLKGTSGFYCTYQSKSNTLTVTHSTVAQGANDTPPKQGVTIAAPAVFLRELSDGPIQHNSQHTLEFLQPWLDPHRQASSQLLVPVVYDDQLKGIGVVCDSRYERYFFDDELGLALNLAAHSAVVLRQAELFQSVQSLEKLKSEMIRMASHDLRNPLGQVSGYIELFIEDMQEFMTPDHAPFVQGIRKGIKTIQTLLEDILNLERVESQGPESWKGFQIGVILQEVVDNLEGQAHLKDQNFNADLPPQNYLVLGSAIQIRQAFTNLIGNAIKYTPEHGTVLVRTAVAHRRFHFEVEDNGYGIPADRQARLFERFFRAQTPGTEHIEGTGLGLSLVKTVIEQHGGEIWFESEEGKGSIFGFWLPLLVQE
ncbi:MAG: response regulator [Anaerolineales bacterium]|nr:response regulator [Anaerolineales bacterium]